MIVLWDTLIGLLFCQMSMVGCISVKRYYNIRLQHVNIKTDKKSALMLIRRARAYSSSCSQVILVSTHSFVIHSSAVKNRKNH